MGRKMERREREKNQEGEMRRWVKVEIRRWKRRKTWDRESERVVIMERTLLCYGLSKTVGQSHRGRNG